MGRWTHHEEDTYRLPEGLVRVAYDADSAQYTFRDTKSGKLYRSAPGATYGTLSPVSDTLDSRPNAFAPPHGHSRSQSVQDPFLTFHDILPSHAITTSPQKTSSSSIFGSRFRTPASNHLRSQSAHVPSSSQATNVLHARSKSDPKEGVRSRSQHGTHYRARNTQHEGYHQHDVQSCPRNTQRHNHNQRVQGDATPSRKSASNPRFSLSSVLQSLSRSLCGRTRQTNTRQRHPTKDAGDSYIYL